MTWWYHFVCLNVNVYKYLLWKRSPKECDVFYEVKYFLVQCVRINPTYKHQNEHYNYFHFSFCKTTLSLFYECVFCYLLQKIFVIVSSHLLYTVCIARLSEGQSGQTVTCGQKVIMQTTFSDFSHFLAKFTTKLDANLIFQPTKLVQRNSRQGSRVRRAQLCQLCWENCQTPRDCIWLSFTLLLPLKRFVDTRKKSSNEEKSLLPQWYSHPSVNNKIGKKWTGASHNDEPWKRSDENLIWIKVFV